MNKLLLKTSVAISSLPVAAIVFAGRTLAQACTSNSDCSGGLTCGSSGQCGDWVSGNFQPTEGFFGSFESLWDQLLTFIMAIGLLLVFMYLIWGGIDWITSGGDKGKTEGARNKITAAVIGLIVLAASYAILQIAFGFLGVSSTFGEFIQESGIK